jgi:ABC-2 type transport system permease protein
VGFGVRLQAATLPAALVVLSLGTLSLAACGYALVAVAPSAKAVTAIGLGILLPLSFFSDIFMIGDAPAWMGTVGSLFPLRHFVHALVAVLDGEAIATWAPNTLAMTAWLVAAAAVALRRFRWAPRA